VDVSPPIDVEKIVTVYAWDSDGIIVI